MWMVVAVVVAGLVTFGLVQSSDGHRQHSAQPPAAAVSSEPADQPPGTLHAVGRSLLPIAEAAGPDGALTDLVGTYGSGRAVPVQSVPAGDGFWVGTGETDRMWVKLVPDGNPALKVQTGQMLDLGGPIVAHDTSFAAAEGVDEAEGASQLTRQAVHIEATQDRVRVVDTP